MAGLSNHAAEIRRTLTDPRSLAEALGLAKGATRQAGGVLVKCCVHTDGSPSLSITKGPDGTIRCKCFGCEFSSDALGLIAAVHNLSPKANFHEVLLEGARIAGLLTLLDELNGKKPYEARALPPAPEPEPERDYPPQAEVDELWDGCGRVDDCGAAVAHLTARKLDPGLVTRLDLARALTLSQRLPRWACYRSENWRRTGHWMLLPMVDAAGSLRSVRSWRVEGDAPAKRLPPAGYRATGLVLANTRGLKMLQSKASPARVLIVEGEPDFVTASLRWQGQIVFGILSGAWNSEFAARVPYGSEIILMTHNDEAGDRYAEIVKSSVSNRAQVFRSVAA